MKAETINRYKNKTVGQLRKRAKFYFHKYIRLRDCDEYGYAKCISSGQPLKYGSPNCQAGHMYAAGHYPELEFNEYNVNIQGKSDNYFLGGNQLQYRKNLINKIGIKIVEELDFIASLTGKVPFKHNRFYLIEVIETYKEKCKKLAKDKMFEVK